jgi:hypothetical protein
MGIINRIPWRSIPWKRGFLIIFGGLLSYFVIPLGFSQYNEVKLLREARLARAIKFGDNNTAFNSKVNATATMLRMFVNHNARVKVSAVRLPDAQMDLYRSYQQRRLDLDEAAWWWPSEFAREASALDLLSPDETKELQRLVDEYNKSVLNTMNQVTTLWQFLDSPEYRLDKLSDDKRKAIDDNVGKEMGREYDARNKLVSRVAALLTKSRYRTNTFDLLGL